jgi:hypothetical protein
MFSGQRNSPTSTHVELMSQSGRPHNAIRVANLPLELELRLWEERRNMYNGFLVAFGSRLLFRLRRVNSNGRCTRPTGELVYDNLRKVREKARRSKLQHTARSNSRSIGSTIGDPKRSVKSCSPTHEPRPFPLALLELPIVGARLRSI